MSEYVPDEYLPSEGQRFAREREREAQRIADEKAGIKPIQESVEELRAQGHEVSTGKPEPVATSFARLKEDTHWSAVEKTQRKFEHYPDNWGEKNPDQAWKAGKSFLEVRETEKRRKLEYDRECMEKNFGLDASNNAVAAYWVKFQEEAIRKHREDVRKKLAEIGLTPESIVKAANEKMYL